MALQRNVKTPVCIVDLSYFLHLRCNASVKWYIESFGDELYIDKENLQDYDFVGDDEFIMAYEKQFINSLHRFMKDHRCKLSKTILAKDCKRSDIWRRKLYTNYKCSRDAPKKQKYANISPIFAYTYDILLPKILDKFHIKLLGMQYAEGDDIIAIVSDYITKNSDDDIIIMANDMDICQIITDRIEIFDYRGNSINEKCIAKYGSPKRMLLAKMLQGDRSDDIPNICKGMGEKTAIKCIDDTELLKEKFEKNPDAPKQFRMNQRLIDFKHIPEKLKSAILKKYIRMMEE